MNNTGGYEQQGRRLLGEAESLLESKSGFFAKIFGAQESKVEEAAAKFSEAGNAFKLAKNFRAAGSAYIRAGECFEQSESSHFEAGSKFLDAAKVLKSVSVEDAMGALQRAIQLYTLKGRFLQAAKYNKELAELLEAEGRNEQAILHYEAAADLFDGEDARSHSSGCRVKVAELSALDSKYDVAADLYEQAAVYCLKSDMLRFGAREHLLRAGICRLCLGDDVGSAAAIDRFGSMDASFPSSREGQLLDNLQRAKEDRNVDDFTEAIFEYDRIMKLDPWKTSILLRLKNSIRSEEEDLT